MVALRWKRDRGQVLGRGARKLEPTRPHSRAATRAGSRRSISAVWLRVYGTSTQPILITDQFGSVQFIQAHSRLRRTWRELAGAAHGVAGKGIFRKGAVAGDVAHDGWDIARDLARVPEIVGTCGRDACILLVVAERPIL